MQKFQCRVAPSLGDGFAGDVYETWGVLPYESRYVPTVFFGMYGMRDFQALWNHVFEKHILWAGSDIRNLIGGYWLNASGTERIDTTYIAKWINENCTNWVENSLEQIVLASVGIQATVVPSFLGKIENYPIQKLRTDKERYYTSVSGDDFELYGWDEIRDIAKQNPNTEYHLYGNQKDISEQHGVEYIYNLTIPIPPYFGDLDNVFVHGRVSQKQMDEETKTMTGALRLTRFDGASEILIKSTLWGQKPISPYIQYDWLGNRDILISKLNKYPWVLN